MEASVSQLLKTVKVEAQLEMKTTPSKFSGETSSEIDTFGKESPIETDRKIREDTPITGAREESVMDPPSIPPMSPIDPLVRRRGLSTMVPQNLAALDMPSHIVEFYETIDVDLPRHMEKYIDIWASSLVTNPRYWLVWFSTTLEG